MLLSLAWLQEFTPYRGDVRELADRLTMLGLEIEEIFNPFKGIEPVVVGRTLTCEKHPDADKLSVCTVDVGDAEPLHIVCGAPNVAAGQFAPVARVKTELPGGVKIKKGKIRGQVSMGMICSEKELGLAEESEGILVLPENSVVGQSVVQALNLDDCVLDVGVTPNRADCLSVLGIARETAVAFKLPLTMPDTDFASGGRDCNELVSVEIDNPESCPAYRLKLLQDVKIGPSPAWMRYRLLAVGQRPINNIVDATNYVLFELGQPHHAFDMDKVAGGRIIVKYAEDGQKLVTLDDQERTLSRTDLLICDPEKAVGLAGVMGGANSEMDAHSTNVLLECAVFKAAMIRKTARTLGIPSEASYRYERGVDQPGSEFALHRAVKLMLDTAGGVCLTGTIENEPLPFQSTTIPFRTDKAERLLGVDLGDDFCVETLTALGCGVEKKGEAYEVAPPPYRLDLEREADLVEEVGRVYGLDRIPPVLPKVAKNLDYASRGGAAEYAFHEKVREWGVGLGLNELVNYSFVGRADLDLLQCGQGDCVPVANPLSEDQNVMRPLLAPGMLQSVRHNLARGNNALRLFEIAKVFHACDTSDSTCVEPARLGLVLYGARNPEAWPWAEGDADYADIKGLVEHLFDAFRLPAPAFSTIRERPWLAPEVEVCAGGEHMGVIGRVKPDAAEAFHARRDIWTAELDLDKIRAMHTETAIVFNELAKYPPVRRDITLAAPMDMSVAEVFAVVEKRNTPLLENVSLADVFVPENGETRNLTFRMTYRHASKTLKDKEVEKVHNALAAALTAALPVS